MTREEMEKFIHTPLSMELYEKLKIIYDKGYQDAYMGDMPSVQQKTDVLDKIRAEIKQYQSDYDVHGTEYDRTAWKAFNRCLQIIDKYRNEVSE